MPTRKSQALLEQRMKTHEVDDAKNFAALHETLKRIEDKLDPIADTYKTISRLGRWVMVSAVFIATVLGAIKGWQSLFHK